MEKKDVHILINENLPDFRDVKGMTPEELKKEFFMNLEVNVLNIRRNAEIFLELTQRGIEFDEARFSYGGVLMDVAGGKLHYQVATRFLHSKTTLKKLSEYPMEDQLKIGIKNEEIRLVISVDPVSTVEKNLMSMSMGQRNLVLGRFGLRKIPEQVKILESKKVKKKRINKLLKFNKNGFLKRGNQFLGGMDSKVNVKQIVDALNDFLELTDPEALDNFLMTVAKGEWWKTNMSK